MSDNNFSKRTIKLEDLYRDLDDRKIQSERFENLSGFFHKQFGVQAVKYFSSPGRIEIGGNHTDHNNGCILAAAIDTDTIAIAAGNSNNCINLVSRDLNEKYSIDLSDLKFREEEKSTTAGLIRGIAAKFALEGYKVGGFDCVLESRIGIGSGLSSSASIEVLIGTILNDIYNNSKLSPVEIAKYGQYSENSFFGKPCGLMDQLAIAVGGVVFVDFFDKDKPIVEKLNIGFSDYGFDVIIVNTGATHTDLTDDYSAIPAEMKSVAKYLGKSLCRFISRQEIMENLKSLREELGDRAVLRALHFIEENKRPGYEAELIKNRDIPGFLSLVNQSGDSSFKLLQNIYSAGNFAQQSITLALEMTDYYILKNSAEGACRVHGGGFAGTILTFMEHRLTENYIKLMDNSFGKNSAVRVNVRDYGTCRIDI